MTKITTQEKMNAVVKTLTPSGYKMGDKFTLIVGELTATYDNRQHYSGHGAKYNSSIRHGSISVTMTERELSKAYKPIAEKIKMDKKRAIEKKKYLKMCMNPDFIADQARNAVDVIGQPRRVNGKFHVDGEWRDGLTASEADAYWTDKDERNFWESASNGYHGCGVYRTGWKNGKMTCTLYRGFHGSCPYGIDEKSWIKAVTLEMKKYSDHIVKMDGSGNEFFFSNTEDADLVTNAIEVYCVPTLSGGLHLNIQPAFAEVIATNQITNG
jgi:hypothetical protein